MAAVSLFSQPPLRPCPFCGCSQLLVNSDLEPKFVSCTKCSAFGPSAPTITEATDRWNKRIDPDIARTTGEKMQPKEIG